MFVVAALYKFTSFSKPALEALSTKLKLLSHEQNLSGTLLLAHEGINGTVAGSRAGINMLKELLKQEALFENMEYKESSAKENPFHRMKVKIKKEIVTLGQPTANPSILVGDYVAPKDWNKLLNDPEITVIDVRNDYEVEMGTFENSLNPGTTNFKEFPEFVAKNLDPKIHKKIAMSCTGGIRCEKASSYMKYLGFEEVYHLKGGILKYLEEIKPSESLYKGECFVFDQRVSLGHGLQEGEFDLCHGCGYPLHDSDKKSPSYEKGVSCARCDNKRSEKQKASAKNRQRQMDLAKASGRKHLGACLKP
jgi:UPF0176 protein